MTAKELARVLARRPTTLGSGPFVVLSLSDYDALRSAAEDALDLMDLERAREEAKGGSLVTWESVKKTMDSKAARRPRRTGGRRR